MNATVSIILLCLAISDINAANIKSRIIGGKEATEREFRYQAQFILNGAYYCGATLITDRHLLSAAHCLEPFFISVFELNPIPILATILIGSIKKLQGIPYAVKRVSRHRGYTPNSEYLSPNDIGIIHLLHSIRMIRDVKPISLPEEHSDILPETSVIVSGFGSRSIQELPSDKLLKLETKTAPLYKCQKKISKRYLNNNHICTLPGQGFGCCHGDSGNPLVDIKKDKILGIGSAGTKAAGNGGPDIYTKVSNYIDYILEEINYMSNITFYSDHPSRNLI